MQPAKAFTVNVLARPGTPSISRCPLVKSPIIRFSTRVSWPTKTFDISSFRGLIHFDELSTSSFNLAVSTDILKFNISIYVGDASIFSPNLFLIFCSHTYRLNKTLIEAVRGTARSAPRIPPITSDQQSTENITVNG